MKVIVQRGPEKTTVTTDQKHVYLNEWLKTIDLYKAIRKFYPNAEIVEQPETNSIKK